MTMEGSGAILLDLNEYFKALSLAKDDQVGEEIQRESLRLITYGYKLELEAIANQSLDSILPLP